MSYFKLLRAHSKNSNTPSIKPLQMSDKQRVLASNSLCIRCESHKAARNSYICEACQAKNTIEDIRDEISALRRKILNKPNSEGDAL